VPALDPRFLDHLRERIGAANEGAILAKKLAVINPIRIIT
jgi:hypothetical protein